MKFVFLFLPALFASLLCSCGEPHESTKTFTENCRIGICECPEVEKTWYWEKVGLRHDGDIYKLKKLWRKQMVKVRKLGPPKNNRRQQIWIEGYNSRKKHTKEAKQALSQPDKQTQEDESDLEQNGNSSILLFGSLASVFVIFLLWFFLFSKRKTRRIPQPKDECPMCGGSVSPQDEKCPNPDCGVVL